MSLTIEELTARYSELWVRLNATGALIEELEAQRREIKTEQRRIANQIVSGSLRSSEPAQDEEEKS